MPTLPRHQLPTRRSSRLQRKRLLKQQALMSPTRPQHPRSPNWSRSGVPVAGPKSGVRSAMTAIGIVALIALPKARSLLPQAKLQRAKQATAPSANVIGTGGATVTVISANFVPISRRRMALFRPQPELMARLYVKRVMTGKAGRRAIASMARDTAETGIRASPAKMVDATRAGTRVAATEADATATEAVGKAVRRIGNMRRAPIRASAIVRLIPIRRLPN